MGCFSSSQQESIQLLPRNIPVNACRDEVTETINLGPDVDHSEIISTLDNAEHSTKQLIFGYGLGVFGVALVTGALACAQALDQSIPHSELNGFRFSFQLAIAFPFLIGYNRCDVRVKRKHIGWIALCAILSTLASYGFYGAVYYLPLGVTSGIKCSVVLIINFALGVIQSKFVRWYDIISVTGCVSGVIMIAQPMFLFHHNNLSLTGNNSHSSCHVTDTMITPINLTSDWISYHEETDTSDKYNDDVIGYIMCVSSGVAIAAYIRVVNIKLSDVSIFVYNFWSSLLGIASSFCIMAAAEDPYIPTLPQCITWFLLHSIMSGGFFLVMYKHIQIVDPLVASLIQTLQIPASFILQYTLFSNLYPGHADAVGISGSIIVILGNAFVPLYKLTEKLCAK